MDAPVQCVFQGGLKPPPPKLGDSQAMSRIHSLFSAWNNDLLWKEHEPLS